MLVAILSCSKLLFVLVVLVADLAFHYIVVNKATNALEADLAKHPSTWHHGCLPIRHGTPSLAYDYAGTTS